MRVLIVGGTGLISTAITQQLLERGAAVVHFNRGQSPQRFQGAVERIGGDRRDHAAFEGQMAAAGHFDAVIDMICYLPEEAASAVRAFGGRTGQYIFCSTVDVYTKPARRYPIQENAERKPDPAFAYAWRKAACEAVLLAAHARQELPVTILRPAHTYGEGGALIHTFGWDTRYLDRIRRGRPIVVHGDGTSLWSSCHVDDVAAAFVNAIGRPQTLGKAYHVTGEEWLTWNGYHEGVAEALGAPPPRLVHIPTDLLARAAPDEAAWCKLNFQFDNIFDNRAAHADLDFRYTVPWVEGVRRTVAWLDAQGKIEPSLGQDLDDRVIAAWEQAGRQFVDLMRRPAA